MTYADIVVDASPNADLRNTLEAARAIATEHGAKLSVISFAWPKVSLLKEALVGNVASAQLQTRAMEEALVATRGVFDEVFRDRLADVTWCSGVGEPAVSLREHLLTADLAIMGPRNAESFIAVESTDLALRSGAPVLKLGKAPSTGRFGQVLVAWKDCPEARRAVHDALPILRRADSVTIVGVGEEVRTDRLEAVSEHLRRHRVAAAHVHLSRSGESVCAQLLAHAHADGADLIVSGAYSRSRRRERILGGVTRDLHAEAQLPWFTSH